jgi:hypothetical protein
MLLFVSVALMHVNLRARSIRGSGSRRARKSQTNTPLGTINRVCGVSYSSQCGADHSSGASTILLSWLTLPCPFCSQKTLVTLADTSTWCARPSARPTRFSCLVCRPDIYAERKKAGALKLVHLLVVASSVDRNGALSACRRPRPSTASSCATTSTRTSTRRSRSGEATSRACSSMRS